MGAHGHVAEVLAMANSTHYWTTAGDYHLAHAVGLLVLCLAGESKALRAAWWLMALGMMIFSGSLYVLSYTGIKWLGAITPIGGLLMIAGWIVAAIGGCARRGHQG
jgi:uncharacterized membrane protein YgdD (TMEM256/DUF423 family)